MHPLHSHAVPAERLFQETERFLSFIVDEIGPIDATKDVLQSALSEALMCGVPEDANEILVQWFRPFLDRSIKCHLDLTSNHQQLHTEINDMEAIPDSDGPWEESPRNCVLESIRALRRTDALFILWLDIQGHSQKEMMRIMEMPLSAVSARHVRARARLRILLEDRCGACHTNKCAYRYGRRSRQEQDGPEIGSLSIWAMSTAPARIPMALIRF